MSGANVEVYSVDPSTGALTKASGSPFNLGVGVNDPYSLIAHPNGQWVYVCDYASNVMAAFSLSSAGAPTGITSAHMTSSAGCDWNQGFTITPNGKYLYAADADPWISVFTIDQTTGALTAEAGNLTGGSTLIAIAATDSYVYAADNPTNTIYVYKINSDGTLTAVTSKSVSSTYNLASAALDRTGKYLYVGDTAGRLYGYSVGSDGSLTSLGSPITLQGTSPNAEWQIVFSVDNKFMYVSDTGKGVHALTFDASTGAAAELSASPYQTAGGGTHGVAVDPSNKFVYSDDHYVNIAGWARDSTTGALSGRMDTTSSGGVVVGVAVTY